MWLIHIDTWNYPDPQKIIDLIPEDVRPFVVMNIGLSISGDAETGQFHVAEYGYEIARSWLRVCAENRMWAVVQHASGGPAQFSDFDLSVYEEFFREYPNMLGFNYSEQFWGYDNPNDVRSPRWIDRIAHFANLLELSNQYGGYLIVSWCGNQWNPHINPIGMLKRNPDFAEACREYTENYLLFEKYTQSSYQLDMESVCLGAYLSGYSGQYGIRYDDTGWSDANGEHENFTMATQAAVQLEHMMLTGETMVDGPELIWTQCFREISAGPTTDGYSTRRWDTFSQFDNVSVDLFRKVIDGTLRIPTREEVIKRTKFVIVNDVNLGTIDDIYSSPETLFEDLYSFEGNLRDNKNFFKKSGRYPSIPTVYALDDALANSFEHKVNKSDFNERWPDIGSKVAEFESVFPQEYTGDIYAGRHENGWVIYNPFKTGQTATGSVPFKYNTCERIDLELGEYTAGIMKEYSDRITLYLSNYDEYDAEKKADVVKLYGSLQKPTYSYQDRGDHAGSTLSETWMDGVYTLTVQHNGPLDLEINCAGSATERLSEYTEAAIVQPAAPMPYEGPVQYEFEVSEYKSISSVQRRGQDGSVRNYSGQGYVRLGTNASAGLRDTVTVRRAGEYRLETKYSVTGGDVNSIDLFVNGVKVATPTFKETSTYSDWGLHRQVVTLSEGANTVELRANATGSRSVYFDSLVVAPMSYGHGNRIEEGESGFTGLDGDIRSEQSGYTGSGYANPTNTEGAGIRWTVKFDDSVTKSFTFRYASLSGREAALFLDGGLVSSRIWFEPTESLDAWDHVTVYANVPDGVGELELRSTVGEGLPNIDSLELLGGSQWSAGELPFKPLGVTASSVSISQIDLSWDTAQGADSYTVLRGDSQGGPYAEVASGLAEARFSDTGLAELTDYHYVVRSVNGAGISPYSDEVQALTGTVALPVAPSGLQASASGFDEATLQWDAVVGADQYGVKRSYYAGGPYEVIASDISGTEYVDTGLKAGVSYFYVLTATNANGEGPSSSEFSVSTSTVRSVGAIADTYVRDAGSAAQNFGDAVSLAVKQEGDSRTGFNRRTYLKFDVSEFGEAQKVTLLLTPFQVDFNPSLDFKLVTDDNWVETKMTWNTETTAIGALISNESGFVVGTEYAVDLTTVAKEQAAGDGILSIQISQPNEQGQFVGFNSRETADVLLRPRLSVELNTADIPPQIPSGIEAVGVSESQIDLSWNESLGANSYHVKRALSSGGPYESVSDAIATTAYSDLGLSVGARYYYVLSSSGSGGESADSVEVHAVPSVEIGPEEYVFASMEILEGGRLSLQVARSELGHRYQIYATDDLAYPDWKPIGPELQGDGGEIGFEIDLATVGTSRFFKLGVSR